MRKLIYNLAVSLDGFIEGPEGEFDWCFTDQDYGMTDFMAGLDTIIFGRKSFEVMLQYEANPYPSIKKYVCSTTLKQIPENTVLIKESLLEEVRKMKQEAGKNIWLFGGSSLAAQLLNANLLDELQLSVHPIMLGQGKSVSEGLKERKHLQLVHTKVYESRLIQLHYQTVKNHISPEADVEKNKEAAI